MSNRKDKATIEDLRNYFRKIYFSRKGSAEDGGGAERANVLFQMAREYRDLFCHENELLNQRKVFFWSTQAMLCSAYYYILLREESATALILLMFLFLQIFLCVSGLLFTIRFLQKLYCGEQAKRFLRFRYQTFLELYCSWIASNESDEDSENGVEMLPWLAIPTSLSPLFPPIVGLAKTHEELSADTASKSVVEQTDVRLNCDVSCAEILLQIINQENDEKKLSNKDNDWYFEAKPNMGILAGCCSWNIPKIYATLLPFWWLILFLVAIISFYNNNSRAECLSVLRVVLWPVAFIIVFYGGALWERRLKRKC